MKNQEGKSDLDITRTKNTTVFQKKIVFKSTNSLNQADIYDKINENSDMSKNINKNSNNIFKPGSFSIETYLRMLSTNRKERDMSIEELKKNYPILDLFVQLAEIPSPSKKEHQVQQKILEIFNKNNINAKPDNFGNIIAKIPAAKGYESVPPLLLSAHMDVVGGSEPVNIKLSKDKKYIETDKTRTLGADDKVGVAAAIDLALKLTKTGSNIPHGPIEICFTCDEEMGMSGVKNLNS